MTEPHQEREQTPRWRLKAMTFNIRYGTANDGANSWDNRKALLYQVLRTHQPDILGLQEAIEFQLDDITKAVPGYQCIGRSRDADPSTGELAPLCIKTDTWAFDTAPNEQGTFWLSQTPETPGSKSWGSSLPRIATWARLIHKATNTGLYVFNTHFDHISAQARLESARLLSRRMAGRLRRSDPVLLMGDLNAGEGSDPVRFLKGETIQGTTSFLPLVDTFRKAQPNASNVGTIHSFRGIKTRDKIDYIFAISGWTGQRIDAASILHDNDNGRYPSDHFPVTAELSYPLP